MDELRSIGTEFELDGIIWRVVKHVRVWDQLSLKEKLQPVREVEDAEDNDAVAV